jgi:signal recognition particle receptor subunit alpha
MLDFFAIFSKGGILLFCFKEYGLHKKAWESFVQTVNSLNRTVFLQDKSDGENVFEQGLLALKYKIDNKFDLVFVVGYQKILPLNYLNKLLDEIQLRFRNKYAQDLKEFNFQSNFNDFTGEFETTCALVERKFRWQI